MTQDQIITECLNGERTRDCDWCPAHYTKGGKCCFGKLHEHDDPQCRSCIHQEDCAPLTHDTVSQEPAPSGRVIYHNRGQRTSTAPAARRGLPILQGSMPSAQPGEPLLVETPIVPEPVQLDDKDTMVQRFFKVAFWGAAEGFFEMALRYFRKRRPD